MLHLHGNETLFPHMDLVWLPHTILVVRFDQQSGRSLCRPSLDVPLAYALRCNPRVSIRNYLIKTHDRLHANLCGGNVTTPLRVPLLYTAPLPLNV